MPRAPDTISTLLITDGGLCASVAALLDRHPESLTLWLPPQGCSAIDWPAAPIANVHHDAARAFADRHVLSVSGAPRFHWPVADTSPESWDAHTDRPAIPDSVMLLLALDAARSLGAKTVVWPIAEGDSVQRLTRCDQIARHAEGLANHGCLSTDASRRPIEVHLPLADLTQEQVADLAHDLGAPIEACWWAGHLPDEPESTMDARMCWSRALDTSRAALT